MGLEQWSFAGNTKGFGNTQGDPTWIGDFTASGHSQVLFYSPGDQNWWLGSYANGQLQWSLISNTKGFGNTQGYPTWIGDFTASGHSQVLFYSPGDQNWWLGSYANGQLQWSLISNTKGFGNTQGDPTWIGDFTACRHSQVLFYSPGDQNWWLGSYANGQLQWSLISNTTGFGNTAGDPTWVGDFTASGHSQVLFYAPAPNLVWWLGSYANGQLQWSLISNAQTFTPGDPTWIWDFAACGHSQVLFYSPGDQNWWLGSYANGQLQWNLISNTTGFGDTAGDPTWVGDFTASGHSQVLFYAPAPNLVWWLGSYANGQLQWSLISNAQTFTPGDPTWIGDFTACGQSQVLFYSPGDQNWWLGLYYTSS